VGVVLQLLDEVVNVDHIYKHSRRTRQQSKALHRDARGVLVV
jgi:hypothetical protein